MKIAYIGARNMPEVSSSMEKHIKEIASRMINTGHDVFVYAQKNKKTKKNKQYEKINIFYFPNLFLASTHALFQKYDIIHYHGINASSFGWIFKIFKPKTGIISTFHHQNYINNKRSTSDKILFNFAQMLAYKFSDITICASDSIIKCAQEKQNMESVKIINGTEKSYIKDTDLISKWGLKDKKYILFVGKLQKQEGVHYLIEAFKQIENTSKLPNNFKLVIIEKEFGEDEYIEYLHTISKGRESIIFAPKIAGESLGQFFSHAYLFVHPSELKDFSHFISDAMRYGVAILISDLMKNFESIENCGFWFENKNVISLRDKLAYLLNRPIEVETFGKRAAKKMNDLYGWDSAARKTLEIYNEIIFQKNQKNEKK